MCVAARRDLRGWVCVMRKGWGRLVWKGNLKNFFQQFFGRLEEFFGNSGEKFSTKILNLLEVIFEGLEES